MNKKEKSICLTTYTKELCHQFYSQYISDPMMTEDGYTYQFEQVEKYYEKKVLDSTRRFFAITFNEEIVGEIQLKRIDLDEKIGTMSIVLMNDTVKNKGYGTEAEKLIIDYAFNELSLETVLADAVIRNTRSIHVLEKLGFKKAYEEEGMVYYQINKSDINTIF